MWQSANPWMLSVDLSGSLSHGEGTPPRIHSVTRAIGFYGPFGSLLLEIPFSSVQPI